MTEAEYIPSPAEWVRNQVELYESSGGREGNTLRGLPVVLVTHTGRHTGATRKTPLMRVVSDGTYVLVASMGGAPEHPVWYHNLLAHPEVTVRDGTEVMRGRARLVEDSEERARLWAAAVEAFPPYAEYQEKTERVIPMFAFDPE
ncbi:MAG: nitroreductase family deazaflavin-dependent oxidoreductase [Dehalococcoidia bacterium]|nr:nitroreductase family deazaflavin-dependent oxidoreductase [Dehalococcoidia bacterium]